MNLSKIIYNWCFCIQKIGLLVKKISESHEICVSPKKHTPHTIREICVSQRKAKRDPCEKSYFSSRSATA